jgi:adenosine deaminase
VCLSSNYHTGAVKRGALHPLERFLEAGVPVALCCDNSTVSRTDAVRESRIATAQVGVEAVEAIHRGAEAYTFIKPETALATRQDD